MDKFNKIMDRVNGVLKNLVWFSFGCLFFSLIQYTLVVKFTEHDYSEHNIVKIIESNKDTIKKIE